MPFLSMLSSIIIFFIIIWCCLEAYISNKFKTASDVSISCTLILKMSFIFKCFDTVLSVVFFCTDVMLSFIYILCLPLNTFEGAAGKIYHAAGRSGYHTNQAFTNPWNRWCAFRWNQNCNNGEKYLQQWVSCQSDKNIFKQTIKVSLKWQLL